MEFDDRDATVEMSADKDRFPVDLSGLHRDRLAIRFLFVFPTGMATSMSFVVPSGLTYSS